MNWKIEKAEMIIVDLIVARACKKLLVKPINLSMDIVACHCNGNPLDLSALLAANDLEFYHDVAGIYKNWNRRTGKLDNFFTPRFSKQF